MEMQFQVGCLFEGGRFLIFDVLGLVLFLG